MIKGFTYLSLKGSLLFLLFIVLACASCSKPDDPPPVTPTPPTPTPATPSGAIEYFYADTNLVGFNRFTQFKWLVSGANLLTKVTLSGVLVGVNGPSNSGLLRVDTTFTLAINNGAQKTFRVMVADSITTLLWNDGLYAKKTRSEVYYSPSAGWKDTAVSAAASEERIFFNLNKTTTIIIINNPSPPDGGPFTVTPGSPGNPPMIPPTSPTFTWRNTTFTILSADAKNLVVLYKAYVGATLTDFRDTYTYM